MGALYGRFLRFAAAVLFFIFSFSSVSFSQQTERTRFSNSLRFLQERRFDEASRILQELVVAFPQKNLYWFNLGIVEAMQGHHEYAIKVFERVTLMKSPLAPASQLYAAKSFRALGRNREAEKLLQGLNQQSLPPGLRAEVIEDLEAISADVLEDEVLSAYRAGQYEKASELLARGNEKALTAEGALLYSIVLLRQKRSEQARDVLQRLLKSSSLSSERRLLATDLLNRTLQAGPYPYWVTGEASAGYNSNVFSDGKSISGMASFLLRSNLSAGYHFQQARPLSFQLAYLLNYDDPTMATELRTLSQTIQSPVLLEKLSLRIIPYHQWQTWAGVPVSQKNGVALKFSQTFEKWDGGFDADCAAMTSLNSGYSYLQGSSFSLKPYLGFWGLSVYLQLNYFYGNDGTQDIVYGDGSLLPLQHSFQGPGLRVIWRPAQNMATFLNLSSIQKSFRTLSLPAAKARSDREFLMSLKHSYWLTPKFSVYGLAEYTANTSTLGSGDVRDKNYEIFALMTGFIWDVF